MFFFNVNFTACYISISHPCNSRIHPRHHGRDWAPSTCASTWSPGGGVRLNAPNRCSWRLPMKPGCTPSYGGYGYSMVIPYLWHLVTGKIQHGTPIFYYLVSHVIRTCGNVFVPNCTLREHCLDLPSCSLFRPRYGSTCLGFDILSRWSSNNLKAPMPIALVPVVRRHHCGPSCPSFQGARRAGGIFPTSLSGGGIPEPSPSRPSHSSGTQGVCRMPGTGWFHPMGCHLSQWRCLLGAGCADGRGYLHHSWEIGALIQDLGDLGCQVSYPPPTLRLCSTVLSHRVPDSKILQGTAEILVRKKQKRTHFSAFEHLRTYLSIPCLLSGLIWPDFLARRSGRRTMHWSIQSSHHCWPEGQPVLEGWRVVDRLYCSRCSRSILLVIDARQCGKLTGPKWWNTALWKIKRGRSFAASMKWRWLGVNSWKVQVQCPVSGSFGVFHAKANGAQQTSAFLSGVPLTFIHK